jgi:Holliday junction resolvase-like predicted endonuclease
MPYNLIENTDAFMCRKQFSLPRGVHLYPSEASVSYTDIHGLPRVIGQCARQTYYRLTGQPSSGSYDAYMQWIFALGKAVEEILVEQWKQMGIWVANNVRFYDVNRNISGELDVILKEPDGTLFFVEVKSFASYQATKHICGNKSVKGKPKDNQLLQALIYADLCKELNLIQYGKMIYYARDSGQRREFNISLTNDNGLKRPVVEGTVDYRFTMEDIYERYALLQSYVNSKQLPPRDYELEWGTEKVEIRNGLGEIAKTNYEKWKKSPVKYPIGDWNCKRCPWLLTCYDLT